MAREITTEYGWSEPKNCSHDYLLGTVLRILEGLSTPKTAQILDAGCGGGYIVNELYRRGYGGIWGFDISKSGIEISRSSFPEIEERFKVHDAYDRELPESFPITKYDLALSVEVIEHLYSPKTYLRNINYWLKPKGYIVLTTPYHGYLKNLVISLLNQHDRHFNPLHEGGHIKFFSKGGLYGVLEDAAFKPVRFFGSGRFPYLWKSMVVVAQKV